MDVNINKNVNIINLKYINTFLCLAKKILFSK